MNIDLLTVGVWLIAIVLIIAHWQKIKEVVAKLIRWVMALCSTMIGLGVFFSGVFGIGYGMYWLVYKKLWHGIQQQPYNDWHNWAGFLGGAVEVYGCYWLYLRWKAIGWRKTIRACIPFITISCVGLGLCFISSHWVTYARNREILFRIASWLFLIGCGSIFWFMYAADR